MPRKAHKKKDDFPVKKYIVTYSLIFVVALLLFFSFYVLPRHQIIKFSYDVYDSSESQVGLIQETIRDQLQEEFFSKIKDFSEYTIFRYNMGTHFAFWTEMDLWMKDDVTIFYDCDTVALVCKSMTVSSFDELQGKIFDLSNKFFKEKKVINMLFVDNFLFFPKDYTDEELLSTVSLFESDLKGLKIAEEMDLELRSLFKMLLDFQLPKRPLSDREALIDFYSGKTSAMIKDLLLTTDEFAFRLTELKTRAYIAFETDSSIEWLEQSIAELSKISYNRKIGDLTVEEPEIDHKVMDKMQEEIKGEMLDLRFNLIPSDIAKFKVPVDESKKSKTIRLRILQYLIAKDMIEHKCAYEKECMLAVVDKTDQYHLCDRDVECLAFLAKKLDRPELCKKTLAEKTCLYILAN